MTTGISASSRRGLMDRASLGDPSYQAFLLLRAVFAVAPILFGLDKFANLLVDWPSYLATWIDDLVPGTAQQAMYAVGVVEVLAGIAVALVPRFGGWLVAGWLAGIIVSLLTIPGFHDIVLRDFGLLVAAAALARLSSQYAPRRPGQRVRKWTGRGVPRGVRTAVLMRRGGLVDTTGAEFLMGRADRWGSATYVNPDRRFQQLTVRGACASCATAPYLIWPQRSEPWLTCWLHLERTRPGGS